MIVSGTVNAFDRAVHADVFLPKGASSPAEMIERIRVLVARKRGPKKAVLASAISSQRNSPITPTLQRADSFSQARELSFSSWRRQNLGFYQPVFSLPLHLQPRPHSIFLFAGDGRVGLRRKA